MRDDGGDGGERGESSTGGFVLDDPRRPFFCPCPDPESCT